MNKLKSIINGVGRKVKSFYNTACQKSPYIEPVVVISGSLLVVLIVVMSVLSVTKQEIIAIETNRAEVAFYNNNYDQAIVEYENLQEGEAWPFYQVKIAEIYSLKGEVNKSNELLKVATLKRSKVLLGEGGDKYKEKDKEFINYVLFTYFMNGEYEQAISLGEEYIKQNGNDKALMRTMYAIYMANGQKDKAIEVIETYEVDKESAYDLALLAKMNILADNWDTGFELLNEAFSKEQNEIKVADVITELATYNREELITKLTELNKSNQDELSYKMWLVSVYSMSPETENLANDIISELNIDSENDYDEENTFDEYYIDARKSFEQGDYNNAFELSKRSILANREYPDNYGVLIPEIMKATDKNEMSEGYFRTALQKEPFNYNIIIKTAEYYKDRAIDNEKAKQYYKLSLAFNTNDSETYYNLATLDLLGLLDKNIDSGIVNLNKAIELDGSVGKYHRTLGTVYLNQGEDEKAIESIRSAYSIDENDLLALNNAGCYYIAIDGDVERGMENIKGAYDGINNMMDEETKAGIIENYNEAKKIYDEYNLDYEVDVKISDFTLFY